MNLFSLFSRRAEAERIEPILAENDTTPPVEASGITPGTPAYEWLTGGGLGIDRALSERQAMSVSAVYACVSLIGGAVASLPLHIYRRTVDGRERLTNDIWWALNEQMSAMWPAAVGWEFGLQSLLLHGDLFMRIDRASRISPNIVGFTPYHPLSVDVRKIDGRLWYLLNDDGVIQVCDQDDMIHVPGPGFDGKRGLSQIRFALRQPANVAIDAGRQAANVLSSGMRPDLALIPPENTKLDAEQIKAARAQWVDRYSGEGKGSAPVVLSGGTKIERISLDAEDAQLLETRNFQVEDIARIFGVPPFMVGRMEKTTSWGSGVEAMGIGFTKYTLQRHLVKIEQEINRKCFKTVRHFCEFDTKGLERGDIKTRNESYRIALGRAGEPAWMTVNEVRKAENLPPVAGGDSFPSNEAKQDGQQQNPPASGQ